MSFEEAVGHDAKPAAAAPALENALAAFLASARKIRMAAQVGAPMPAAQARAWDLLLDDAERFIALKADAQWTTEASRVRLQLEAEFQTDARAIGRRDHEG